MIRILHVLGRLDCGGAETLVMNWYRNINRDEIQFDFVIHTEEECYYSAEIRRLGGRIFSVPRYSGFNHANYITKWQIFFSDHPEYKIIHGHVRSTASIYLKIAKQMGLTTISHSHSVSNGIGISSFIKNMFQKNIRYTSDYFFACSESAGIWLFGKDACKKDNFYVLKNAIDCDKYRFNSEIREQIRSDMNIERKFVVGHVGRFCSPKNHKFLLEVFKKVHQRNINSVLLLIGSGELENSIKNKTCDMGLSNFVKFLGNRSDVPDLLQGMDCFVFPSVFEGLGISLMEAQAAGLPCVISDKVPKEAFIAKSLKILSLKQKKEEWAESVLKAGNGYIRKDMTGLIKKAGYDIKENAKWIERFYTSI